VTKNFVVGHNMPGYLPESDPWITDDWESARDSLLEDMDRHADSLADFPSSEDHLDSHELLHGVRASDERSTRRNPRYRMGLDSRQHCLLAVLHG
jgi:hypothetical protein